MCNQLQEVRSTKEGTEEGEQKREFICSITSSQSRKQKPVMRYELGAFHRFIRRAVASHRQERQSLRDGSKHPAGVWTFISLSPRVFNSFLKVAVSLQDERKVGNWGGIQNDEF